MVATSKEFLELIVEPTVTEFIQSPYDLRRGLLAAIVLTHMADHIAQEGKPAGERPVMDERVANWRTKILDICPNFCLVQDVANATKHAKRSTSKHGAHYVPSSDKISTSPGLFQAPFSQGSFAEACEITVDLPDGTSKPLLDLVMTVSQAWRSLIT